MDAEQKIIQRMWNVLVKIQENNILSNYRDLHINFGFATDEEEKILFRLQDEGVIELINLNRDTRIINSMNPQEVKIDIKQPEFDEMYNQFKSEQGSNKTNTGQADVNNKQAFTDFVKFSNFKGKEKKLLIALASMREKSSDDLEILLHTSSLKSLVYSVNQKLKNTNWKIVSHKYLGKPSTYQLHDLTDQDLKN